MTDNGRPAYMPEHIPPVHEDIDLEGGDAKICFPPIKDHSTGKPIPVYPQAAKYAFQEFAGPVFELGGYGDMTMIDPYSGRRLWVSAELLGPEKASIYDSMKRVIEIAERNRFLERTEGTPQYVVIPVTDEPENTLSE
jgi:hypothetical protein